MKEYPGSFIRAAQVCLWGEEGVGWKGIGGLEREVPINSDNENTPISPILCQRLKKKKMMQKIICQQNVCIKFKLLKVRIAGRLGGSGC